MLFFDRDTTVCWACREGDYLLWARFRGLFSPPGQHYEIGDVWEMSDGNFVTLTNRLADLPHDFDLHPLEVSGSLVPWMLKRVEAGYTPDAAIDGPNLWKVCAGDRIAWVGTSRPGIKCHDGVLEVVTFRQDSLVYGEPLAWSEHGPGFGALTESRAPAGIRLCEAGWAAINSGGLPNEATADAQWRLG